MVRERKFPKFCRTLSALTILISGCGSGTAPSDDINASQEEALHANLGETLAESAESEVGSSIAGDLSSNYVSTADNVDGELDTEANVEAEAEAEAEAEVDAQEPAQLIKTNFPHVFQDGVSADFLVEFQTSDGVSVETQLVTAPSGFTYDQELGLARWQPDQFMISARETYYAYFSTGGSQIEKLELIVENLDFEGISATSGISEPADAKLIHAYDFDDDGKQEVLTVDRDNRIYTIEIDESGVIQDWLYPYHMPDNNRIVKLITDSRSGETLLVITTANVYTIKSKAHAPELLFSSSSEIIDAVYEDLFRDGKYTLVLLKEESVLMLDTDFKEIESEIFISTDSPSQILADNLDDDIQYELVLNSGLVIDSVSQKVQWTHSGSFGVHIGIGDITGDGHKEILGSNLRKELVSYSVPLKNVLREYGLKAGCDFVLANIDDDPQDEIISTACAGGAMQVYDVSGELILLDREIPSVSWTSTKFSYVDINGNGNSELVWFASFGFDKVQVGYATVPHANTPSTSVRYDNISKRSNFFLAGRDNSIVGSERSVFLQLLGREGYDGVNVVSLYDDGAQQYGDVVENYNWHMNKSTIVDSDHDGVYEVVVAHPHSSSKYTVNHFAVDDTETLKSYSLPDFGLVDLSVADLDEGNAVAIVATQTARVEIIDLLNQESIFRSGTMLNAITDVYVPENNTEFSFFLGTTGELVKMTETEGGFEKQMSASIGCVKLTTFEHKHIEHVACASKEKHTTGRGLAVLDNELNILYEHPLGEVVVAMDRIQQDVDDALLLAIYNEGGTYLRLLDPKYGLTIWQSGKLLGVINSLELVESETGRSPSFYASSSVAMFGLTR